MISINKDHLNCFFIKIFDEGLGLKYDIVLSEQTALNLSDKIIKQAKPKIVFSENNYEKLINPKNLFISEDEALTFLKEYQSIEDLKAALPFFEKAEMYRCCVFINKIINND